MIKTNEELRLACQHFEECHNQLAHSNSRVAQIEHEASEARKALANREERLARVIEYQRRDAVALDVAREALAP